jgi:outer membrane protein OmpA-like peptidoglycan-associated protein
MWDVFISHASEDKEKIAAPLADELRTRGLRIWYDDFSLELGDSLRRSIDTGLAQSRFGVIILSPSFFTKHWPQRELDGLTSREISGEKVILPVWHGVTHTEVAAHSPVLADRLAVSTENRSIAQVADMIEQAVRRGGSAAETPSRARARTRVHESRRTTLSLLSLGVVAVLALVIFVVITRRPGTASTEFTDRPAADTSHAITRSGAGQSPQVVEHSVSVLGLRYGPSATEIPAGNSAHFDILIESLRRYPNTRVLIVGHTDDLESPNRQVELSRERAQRVVDYLVQRGIDRGRLRIQEMGSAQPMADNSTESGRAQNRRVEMSIY